MSFTMSMDQLVAEAEERIAAAAEREVLDSIEREFLGKKGRFKDLRRTLGSEPAAERPQLGQALASRIDHLQRLLDTARSASDDATVAGGLKVDPSLPGHDPMIGGIHPIVQMMYDLNDAFRALNFDVYSGPEISSELYEFDFMNFPPKHPARESMDTYWVDRDSYQGSSERLCLRPHLTGGSVRYMQQNEPPYRFVYPGRVYRNESTDARHERAFFQYEALIVDKDVTFSSGKLLTSTVLDTVFGRPVETRMRTGFFPFVEPGFEVDMQCQVCLGAGCNLCKGVGWLEIMPGGVPHPNVLRAAGLDPYEWSGFYVNVGLDRLVMMRYGIDDVRFFNGCDVRFLGQFK